VGGSEAKPNEAMESRAADHRPEGKGLPRRHQGKGGRDQKVAGRWVNLPSRGSFGREGGEAL